MKYILFASFLLFIAGSCSDTPTPKPVGYNRIERHIPSYSKFETARFTFSYSNEAKIDSLASESKSGFWFNIVYPQYHARIYCTFNPIDKTSLKKALEDSHRFAYSHAMKAEGIRQIQYQNAENEVYGLVYDIDGNVATPIQFYLTDSVGHFFRASLYYDAKVNADSVMPVTEFIKEDINLMIESFKWQ